jgi:VHL beta domain
MKLCADSSEAQRCARETDFPSQPTAEPAELTVVNRSDEAVKFYWLDRSGSRALYAALPPGGHVQQQSHIGAHWLVSTQDGKCLGIFNAATMTIGIF